MAGDSGHLNNRSSLVYTETTHRALQAVGEAVRVLSDPSKTEWDACEAYLAEARLLDGVSLENRGERVLTRVGAMLRLLTRRKGSC